VFDGVIKKLNIKHCSFVKQSVRFDDVFMSVMSRHVFIDPTLVPGKSKKKYGYKNHGLVYQSLNSSRFSLQSKAPD
jgi:hypothetical protein